eukprot:CAMPEP_0174323350 /NCGR_PEP_ID=MMETSP0810-20121108/11739_1 /TAXON_ID=73025 ORGANISM="Eutreptiella gymnastica-like, Strain CCMP1594" /NCGR_SAMPLE_ID=MMETSP0810 /ASSEMBLY_ACC=CAM_ASM_000659 /LENGTH=79 /DNA_ID=CAMNT_0015435729 /DNA_START=322 /DNA_END=558 /DNA_ORIENTATION=+
MPRLARGVGPSLCRLPLPCYPLLGWGGAGGSVPGATDRPTDRQKRYAEGMQKRGSAPQEEGTSHSGGFGGAWGELLLVW